MASGTCFTNTCVFTWLLFLINSGQYPSYASIVPPELLNATMYTTDNMTVTFTDTNVTGLSVTYKGQVTNNWILQNNERVDEQVTVLTLRSHDRVETVEEGTPDSYIIRYLKLRPLERDGFEIKFLNAQPELGNGRMSLVKEYDMPANMTYLTVCDLNYMRDNTDSILIFKDQAVAVEMSKRTDPPGPRCPSGCSNGLEPTVPRALINTTWYTTDNNNMTFTETHVNGLSATYENETVAQWIVDSSVDMGNSTFLAVRSNVIVHDTETNMDMYVARCLNLLPTVCDGYEILFLNEHDPHGTNNNVTKLTADDPGNNLLQRVCDLELIFSGSFDDLFIFKQKDIANRVKSATKPLTESVCKETSGVIHPTGSVSLLLGITCFLISLI